MVIDASCWHRHGRHVRALESLRSRPYAVTRAVVTSVVRVALRLALEKLRPDEREAAVAQATEGYLAEHLSREGTVREA